MKTRMYYNFPNFFMSQAVYCLNAPNQGCIAAIANLDMDEASTFTASFFTASERDLALTRLKISWCDSGLWFSIKSAKAFGFQ